MWAAAAREASRGWSGPVALAVACAVFWLVVVPVVEWVQRRRDPSPPPPRDPGVIEQGHVVSDTADTGWWGQIVDVGGVRMRRVQQVLKTGSAHLPELDGADEEIDLSLDDGSESVESWVTRVDGTMPYAEIVRAGMDRFGVSESTMKRRIRDARDAGEAAA